jgi:hypothetical protein
MHPINVSNSPICPHCSQPILFSRRRACFYCDECQLEFEPERFSDSTAPSAPASRGRVFLSYGHDPVSTDLVSRFERDLRAIGWDPWLDRSEIRFGDDWRRQITKGIHESQHVLAFLSAHSTRKPGVCRQEIAIALGPGMGHVYTVLVEAPSKVSPPLIISHLQWLDMQQWQELRDHQPDAAEALYQDSLSRIVEVLERNKPFSGDIEDLRRWLKPWDSTSDLIALERGFTGRRWLLDGLVDPPPSGSATQDDPDPGEIERWRQDLSGPSVFWISAGPGWGKSAVAARLAHSARSHVMAVHVCRYDQPSTRDARVAIRSIAFQMATQLGDYREQLVRMAHDQVPLEDMNASEMFAKLLSNPLAYMVGGQDDTDGRRLIVIDGLDESIESGKSELMTLIASEFRRLPPWLGLVVTSRPEAPIRRQLGSFGVRHQAENDPRNRRDLAEYIRFWLDGLDLADGQRRDALDSVLQACDGMFLYLSKLKEAVAAGLIQVDQLSDRSRLPRGLGELYERWFSDRFRSGANYANLHRPVLELALAAREPISTELMEEVLGWDAYKLREALEPLGSLCRAQAGVVSLFHKSLSDWLGDSVASGAFHANPSAGHQRLAACLKTKFSTDPALKSVWPDYLLLHGAAHAALMQDPKLGARFLTAQFQSGAANRLLPGPLRIAIDTYLHALKQCDALVLDAIDSKHLAELISRSDTRDAVAPVCDLLIGRKSDWESAFEANPLDSRGATWVFASRWALATLAMHKEVAQRSMATIRDVAIAPSHPLNLPAAYAFKYVGLNRPEWLSAELLAPLCKSWTYSRLVATSLLQQLALKGVDLTALVPWEEFWNPPWQYNRNELDLLAAALKWRGFASPITPRPQTSRLMNSLAHQQERLLEQEGLTYAQRKAVEFFWDAGSDPDRCLELLAALDASGTSREILDMYLRSPIFEAMEVAAGVVANRLNEFSGDLSSLLKLADPNSDYAWGAFIAGTKASIASNATDTFLSLVKTYGAAPDPWCRGLSANYLAKWLRDASETVRMKTIVENEELLVRLLHDHDIWPVQEVFHALQEFSDSLMAQGINWHKQFAVETAPLVSLVSNWQEKSCGWAEFEAAATRAKALRSSAPES